MVSKSVRTAKFSMVWFGWFGFNRGHYVVSTGSNVEAMSIPYTRSLQAAESFMVPVLDVYLTPQ